MANGNTKTKAPMTIFRDADQKPTTDDAVIAASYRALAESVTKGSTTGKDDKQIVAIVKSIPGMGDETDFARANAVAEAKVTTHEVEAVDTPPKSVHIVGKLSDAVEHGAKLDKEFFAVLEREITVREDQRRGPIPVFFGLQRVFGLDALAKEFPEPGSKQFEEMPDGTKRRNNQYDKYETEIITESGKKRKGVGSWVEDLFDTTALGRSFNTALVKIKDERNQAGDNMLATRKVTLRASENTISAKRTYALQLMRTGIKIGQAVSGLEALKPKVLWNWLPAEHGKDVDTKTGEGMTRGPSPLALFDPSDPRKAVAISVNTLLSYDPDAALAKGGTLDALVDTSKRGTKAPPGSGAGKEARPDVPKAHAWGALLAGELEQTAWLEQWTKSLHGNKEALLSWGAIKGVLDYTFRSGSTLGTALKNAQDEQETKEAKETKAA